LLDSTSVVSGLAFPAGFHGLTRADQL